MVALDRAVCLRSDLAPDSHVLGRYSIKNRRVASCVSVASHFLGF